MPNFHVTAFQTVAPVSPAPSTATVAVGSTVTIFDTLLATAAPPTSGPSTVKTEVSTTPGPGGRPG